MCALTEQLYFNEAVKTKYRGIYKHTVYICAQKAQREVMFQKESLWKYSSWQTCKDHARMKHCYSVEEM